MPRMVAELEANKAAAERGEAEHLGYLGGRSTADLTGTTMIQWWRSVEDVYAGPRPFGLADLAGTVPVGRRGEVARQRMGGRIG